MLEIQQIRTNPDEIAARLASKHVANAAEKVADILRFDEQFRSGTAELNTLQQELNQLSKSIGDLMKAGDKAAAEAGKARTAAIKERVKQLETLIADAEAARNEQLIALPNLPHPSVPIGKTADDNVVAFQNDIQVSFDFTPKPHWELLKSLDIVDFELGNKITGAGFPVYKGKGAKLQRALISFFLDRAIDAGYYEIMPPLVVNADSGFGTGQLPDKEGQMYHVGVDDLYLIPTAEVPITNLYRDVIVEEKDLPIKNAGYTPCFRREAGSYGAHVRGLNRLHQFDKVEIVQVVKPEGSYDVLDAMCAHVESILQALELPYRRLALCTGDMSFASAKTYDMEVWSAAQERWLEVSSVSNFETFQANRLKLRYRTAEDRKTALAHTLNGSALALPRIVASLIENNQQADGTVRIPAALQPYTGFAVLS